jgi:hypothetical protein
LSDRNVAVFQDGALLSFKIDEGDVVVGNSKMFITESVGPIPLGLQ